MRRREFFLTCGLLSLQFSRAQAEEADAIAWHDDVMQAWQQAQAEQRPLLLYVSMASCGFCRKMERDTLSDPAIAQQISESFVAARLDGRAHPAFARRLGVTVYPTTVIIAPENRMLDSIRGYAAPEQFQARLGNIQGAYVARRK